MTNDLISRSALKKYVNDNSTHWLSEWDTAGVLLAIEKAPAVDAVEVVRCKDDSRRVNDSGKTDEYIGSLRGKPSCDKSNAKKRSQRIFLRCN